MDKYFYILNHRWLPTPYTHRFFVEKFAKGFEHHGYTVKVIERPDEIIGPGFMMISSAQFYFYWRDGLKNIRRNFFMLIERACNALKVQWFQRVNGRLQEKALKEMVPALAGHDVTMIAWNWHGRRSFVDSLKNTMIYTGEYFYGEPEQSEKKEWLEFYTKNSSIALPIRFAADYDPAMAGDLADSRRNIIVSYIGERRYSLDWQDAFKDREDCRIVPTPPYIGEDERLQIYRHSLVSLGLQSPQNTADRIVSERVFEALAYGCICISSHPDAPAATNGAALHAASADELVRKVAYFSNNPDEAKKVREAGFAFIRSAGTYAFEAGKFIAFAEAMERSL